MAASKCRETSLGSPFAFLLLAAQCFAGAAFAQENSAVSYAVESSISGPDGGWDYASIDPVLRRLYLARNGVAVLNLDTGKWEETLAAGARVNGVLPLADLHRVVFTDRAQPGVSVYDPSKGKVIGSAPAGKGTDGLAYDPKTRLAAVMSGGENGVVTLVDVQSVSAVASIPVGGKLEFPVSDGHGTVYINVESKNEIAVLDLAKRQITRRIPLKGCDGPSGLAYIPAGDLLVSACEGVAKVIRAHDGDDLATLAIGEGADAVIGDPEHLRAFIPCGQSGTLVVLDLSDLQHLRVAQTVKTEVGARTGALDAKTGKLYLPTAQPGPVIPPSHRPSMVPGTFKVLIVATVR